MGECCATVLISQKLNVAMADCGIEAGSPAGRRKYMPDEGYNAALGKTVAWRISNK